MRMPMIYNEAELSALIEEIGFLPLLRNKIPGFSVQDCTPKELWTYDATEGPWSWKGPVIVQSGCAYGKMFYGKAGFISAGWFPDFANYRRDGYDFDARYDEGLSPRQDKLVYDMLNSYDSLLSQDLKRLVSFGKNGRKEFDPIMTHLQMQGYITTINFEYQQDKSGKAYGWGVARYATPERHFGTTFTDAVYKQTPEQSGQKIIRHLKHLLPDASEKQILKFLG